jgi:hypothetical protein
MGKLKKQNKCIVERKLTYGHSLNVARLAMIPKTVIDVAAIKSKELETSVEKRKIQNLYVQDVQPDSVPLPG